MAKSVLERCDLVVGTKEGADYFVAVSSFKVGEGDTKETRYAFGAYLTVPAKFRDEDADKAKAMLLCCQRKTSADNAGLKAKIAAGDITVDEAAAIILSYNGEDFLTRLNETKVREGGGAKADTNETLAIKYLMNRLRQGLENGRVANSKVPLPGADNPPKDAKGNINFNAWAKAVKAGGHHWYDLSYKEVTKEDKRFD